MILGFVVGLSLLLTNCGFHRIEAYGDLDRIPYDDKAKRLIVAPWNRGIFIASEASLESPISGSRSYCRGITLILNGWLIHILTMINMYL